MNLPLFSRVEPIQTMADGTIKQVNPFSGTEVWTVPGRGNRPLTTTNDTPQPTEAEDDKRCAFCAGRKLETPPEKARILADGTIVRHAMPAELDATTPLFRRVPNLFEIVSYDYWRANYGYRMDTATAAHQEAYLANPEGRRHVEAIIAAKAKASGQDLPAGQEEFQAAAAPFFGGGHDVIIADRHVDSDGGLLSSGRLTPDEHLRMMQLCIDSMRDLYEHNRYVSYVAAFQNWLAPAGASFEHLHKQLVAIDDRGMASQREVQLLRSHPNMYNEWAVGYAVKHNLVIAENQHAVLFAGFGHRYPTLEVFSKSAIGRPWRQSAEEVRAVSDLVHAAHAAVGPAVACNEEWHHQPVDVAVPQPWRILIKLRISTLAGFEGGTKIYINTISPWGLKDKVLDALATAHGKGRVTPDIRLGDECHTEHNCLRYSL
ncbi:DUF4921 family protein [Corynebacterium sp. HMSC04H06]|uniref:DUF4921 family protein n=1 Tax=Corynebacterium sp. HMSC04H06 TaxID=1581050 RepID=UPI0008A33C13|nr:DUF4921 family protein [Corynebacterium sp. HMSC04H06]OFS19827.1 UTP--glucose-1-phosphate uridylyltransferase [Corynebacterium sp. HMSC04H06]